MKYKLSDICEFAKEKIDVANLDVTNYISTENMVPDKGGISAAAALPSVVQTQGFSVGDTLVSNIRPYFKKIWYAKNDGGCSNDVLVFRAKEGVNSRFLYYVLADDKFFGYAMATSKGTKMPRGDKKAIMEYAVPAISYDTQCKVADMLSSIDDKIETNTAINKNLEEQAQALFNNAIHQSTSITYESMDSLAEVKGGKRLPKGITLLDKPNSHPYIRVSNLSNEPYVSLSSNFGYVDDETQKLISRYVVLEGDVIISIVGTIGLNAIVDESLNNANLTENCVKLTNLKHVTPEYLLMYLRNPIGSENIKRGTVGAVQLKLPIKNIQALSVPILPKDEMVQLKKSLSLILNKVSVNIIESKKLASIRDTLLPRLMSGEIDVSNIEI